MLKGILHDVDEQMGRNEKIAIIVVELRGHSRIFRDARLHQRNIVLQKLHLLQQRHVLRIAFVELIAEHF